MLVSFFCVSLCLSITFQVGFGFLELKFSFFVIPDLPMEYNPSDHPRASTIFLSKSQTDGKL